MLSPESTRRISEIVADAQSTGRIPSVVLGVVRDRSLAHVAGAGGSPAPDAGTQYRIGSITKTMTAAIVLGLRDDGLVGLDDRLETHLPGTALGGVTLRQLLGHVAGLQREPDGEWWERSTGGDLERLLSGVTAAKQAWPPLRTYHYSNLGYGVLGALITRVTGQDWRTQLASRVLDPLGMERTTYHPVEPFARGYVVHPWRQSLREEPRLDAGAMAAAGQLWSTVTDLAKWAAFLSDPSPRVLAAETVAEMCAPVVISDLETWTHGYGLGLESYRVGERVYVGHGGSMPGYLAQLLVHRPTRTGVVAFANAYRIQGSTLRQLSVRALDTVLDLEQPPPPAPWRPVGTVPPKEIAVLCGRWWWMGREYEVTWREDPVELVMTGLSVPKATGTRFRQESDDRWRGLSGPEAGETLRVHTDAAGDVVALEVATYIFRRSPDLPEGLVNGDEVD